MRVDSIPHDWKPAGALMPVTQVCVGGVCRKCVRQVCGQTLFCCLLLDWKPAGALMPVTQVCVGGVCGKCVRQVCGQTLFCCLLLDWKPAGALMPVTQVCVGGVWGRFVGIRLFVSFVPQLDAGEGTGACDTGVGAGVLLSFDTKFM